MSGYEFNQKLRRYQNLSQKCEVKRGELNFAYKRALKESNDSYLRLSTLAGSTRSKNYTSSAIPNRSQYSYSSMTTPTKNSLNISRHSPIRNSNINTNTNANTNTNINININSFLSNSPINKKNDKKDNFIEDNHEIKKEEDSDDYMEDSQLFEIIHSKNESPKTNSQIDEEFQRLVQQADEENTDKNQDKDGKNQDKDGKNQKPNEEISIEEEAEEGSDDNFEMNNFELHSDANEEDINEENEVNFELKEDGNQFEVDEEEEEDENHNNEIDGNPFEPDNENNDQNFGEEEESSIRSPDKNVTKAIANKVTSSNNDDQINNEENENALVNSNDDVNDQLSADINNNSTISNTDN